jgi:hypothetical protein
MKDLLEVAPRLAVDPCVILQQVVGKARFFRETFRGKIVGVPFRGYRPNGDIPFFNEVFDVGVHETQCYAETAAQVPLGKGVIIGKFVKDL